MSLPAAVSSSVQAVVSGPRRPARVLGVFASAVYLETPGGDLLALVTRDALRLPCSAVLALPTSARPFAVVSSDETAVVGAGVVDLPALSVRAARWWQPPRPRPALDLAGLADRVVAIADRYPDLRTGGARAALHEPGQRLAHAIAVGDPSGARHAAKELVGRGPGLTPSGDDVVAGVLLAARALAADTGDEVGRIGGELAGEAKGRTTTLSAALLRHAAAGHAAPEAVALVEALGGHADPLPAARRLATIGHTSGLDLLLGALLGAHAALDRERRKVA